MKFTWNSKTSAIPTLAFQKRLILPKWNMTILYHMGVTVRGTKGNRHKWAVFVVVTSQWTFFPPIQIQSCGKAIPTDDNKGEFICIILIYEIISDLKV